MAHVEWLTLKHESGVVWRLDITFLLSSYECIFGRGCQGTGFTTPGCCGHGFYFEKHETAGIKANIRLLTEDDLDGPALRQVQGNNAARRQWAYGRDDDGYNSRTVDEDLADIDPEHYRNAACIFFDRRPGQEGCAFHKLALRTDQSIIDTKPNVCWTAPLMTHELGNDEYVLTAMTNLDWGQDESEPLDWWCIEDTGAPYDHPSAVYRTLRDEITAIIGSRLYDELTGYIAHRTPPVISRRKRVYVPVRAD